MESRLAEFDSSGYLLLRLLVAQDKVALLREHSLRYARSSRVQSDLTVPGTPAAYRDPLMEKVLWDLLPRLEGVSGRRLHPTYSYFRVYKQGDALHKHTDRPACEISLSLCLGYEPSETWPLFVEGPKGVVEARLEPGDGLLYKGIECAHWRERFPGQSAVQAFFHYVDQSGPYREWSFDNRNFGHVLVPR